MSWGIEILLLVVLAVVALFGCRYMVVLWGLYSCFVISEYLDEGMLIPKNTSVLIRRVPGRPRKPIVTAPVPEQEEYCLNPFKLCLFSLLVERKRSIYCNYFLLTNAEHVQSGYQYLVNYVYWLWLVACNICSNAPRSGFVDLLILLWNLIS